MAEMSHTDRARDVVITGLGVVSPIGVGREAFWASLGAGRSGVRQITRFDTSTYPVHIGAEVIDFDPKAYVRPRKSLKVMSREIQYGFAAADFAISDAALKPETLDPNRFGVVYGAEMIYCDLAELESLYRQCLASGDFDFSHWYDSATRELFPLWLLRNLPNMIACHVAIVHDARGPCNTIGHSDVSSLGAIIEAVRTIERGAADVMIAGAVGARVHPTLFAYRGAGDLSRRNDEPERASRPFDAGRDGLVNGEGGATFILETREHAERRGAPLLGRIVSYASAHEPLRGNQAIRLEPLTGSAVRRVITDSLQRGSLTPTDINHVNAHGLSTVADDRYEAQAIHDVLGDVPVTAPKSYFGHLGAGGGAVELAVSILGLNAGEIPPTLNYDKPDPACPINVVHGEPLRIGEGEPQSSRQRFALKLSSSRLGQAAALIVEGA